MSKKAGKTTTKVQSETDLEQEVKISEDEKLRMLLQIANRQQLRKRSNKIIDFFVVLMTLLMIAAFSFGMFFLLLSENKHTISFYVGSQLISSIQIRDGEKIPLEVIPEINEAEFEFDGSWYTNSSITGDPFNFEETTIRNSLNLFAGITPKVMALTIHLNDGSELFYTIEAKINEQVNLLNGNFITDFLSQEYKDNYELLGFDANSKATEPTYQVNDKIEIFAGELYAIWKGVSVEIPITGDGAKTIDGEDFENENLNLNYGTKFVINTNDYANIYEENTGARVEGIRVITSEGEEVYTHGEEIVITNDMQFELAFADEINKLTINLNNGEEPLIYYGMQEVTLPVLTKPHHHLDSYNGIGGNIPAGTKITVEGELLYEAVWESNVYCITLNSSGATTGGTNAIYLKYENGYYLDTSATQLLDKIDIPNKSGYNFAGYFLDEFAQTDMIISPTGDLVIFDNTYFINDITIYAHFNIKTYTVEIVENEFGKIIPVDNTTVEYGSSFDFTVQLNEEYESNYSNLLTLLQSYYATIILVSGEGENAVYQIRNITTDIQLSVPELSVNSYIISWLNWDGQLIETSSYAYGEIPVSPANPARAEESGITFEFVGWDRPIVEVTENTTYRSVFKGLVEKPEITQTLTYNESPQVPSVPVSEYFKANVTPQTNAGQYTNENAVIVSLATDLADQSLTHLEWADGSSDDLHLSWEIEKHKLAIPTASGANSFVYNGESQTLSVLGVDHNTMEIVNSSNVGKNVDSYIAEIALKDSENYIWENDSISNITINWEITAAELIVVAKNIAVEFKEELPTFDDNKLQYLLITGFKGSDNASSVLSEIENSFNITVDIKAEDTDENGDIKVGSYAIIVTGVTNHGNYNLIYSEGDEAGKLFVVAQEIVKPTLPVNQQSHVYTSYLITPIVSNYLENRMQITGNIGVGVGKYQIKITLNDGYEWTDGGNEEITLDWEITPAELTITAEYKTKTYGEENPELTYFVSGLLGDDDESVINETIVLTTNALANSPVSGSPYNITFSGALTANNYNITTVNANLFVTHKMLSKPTTTVTSFVYDGGEKELGIGGFDANTMTITGNKKTNVNVNEDGEVIPYIATISLIDNENFKWSVSEESADIVINWWITKAVVDKPTVISSHTYNGESQVPTIVPVNDSVYTILANGKVDAGNYFATVSLNKPNNYTWAGGQSTPLSLDWSIAKFTPTIDAQSGVYEYLQGQVLSDKEINETARGVNGVVIDGLFEFADKDFKPIHSTTTVQVRFTPLDSSNYETVVFGLSVTVDEINITFVSNGGSSVNTIVQEYNTEVDEPTKPSRAHYTFDGWYEDEDLTIEVTWPYTLLQSVTFYAKWTPEQYTISFSDSTINGTRAVQKPNDASTIIIDDIIIDYGTNYTFDLVNDVIFFNLFEIATGKAVVGLQINGAGTVYTNSIPVTGDLTLTFVFAATADKTTINYNGGSENGEGAGIVNAVYLGQSTNVSLKAVYKKYYTLKGFATENVAWDNANLGDSITLYNTSHFENLKVQAGVVTYYAIWEPITINFVYNANGGSGEASGELLAKFNTTNFSLASIGSLTRIGYTFNGWSKTLDGELAHNSGASINLNVAFLESDYSLSIYEIGDTSIIVTLFANWTRNQTIINFNFGAGIGTPLTKTFFASDEILAGELYPDSATYESHAFKGWSETSGGSVITGSWTVPLTETTLYAIWELITIDITFNAGDGTIEGMDSLIKANIESEFTLPAYENFKANKSGYVLAYFVANITIGDKLVGYKFQPSETIENIGNINIIFTAYYEEDENPYGKGLYHTMYFGEYPKTYVGSALNTQLESYITNNNINSAGVTAGLKTTGKVYTTNSVKGASGIYTPKDSLEYELNGERYVRVENIKYSTASYVYQDGTKVPSSGSKVWFKVEPIRWIITNWDKLPKHINPEGDGTASKIDLLAEQSLVAGIPFYPNISDANKNMWNTSTIRDYLNNTFISQSFNGEEASRILTSTIPNTNGNGTGYNSPTGAAGQETNDKLFLLSYYDVFNADSSYSWLFASNSSRRDSPTDFAISNNAYVGSYSSIIRENATYWRLRSIYSSNVQAVDYSGARANVATNNFYSCIRPAMSISLYHTIEFGEYPKTYVGNSLKSELETAYNGGNLQNGMVATGKSYTTNSNTNNMGEYTPKDSFEYGYNGERYVRLQSITYYNVATYTYVNGEQIPRTSENRYVWFKVEPIRWIVLNWDNLPTHINPKGDGTATRYELIAEQSLVGGIPFYPNNSDSGRTLWQNSTIRTYLNETFIYQAFSSEESSRILTSTLSNTNDSGTGYDSPNGAGEECNTDDKLYLLSYYEIYNTSSPYNWLFGSNDARMVSPTDFCLSNNTSLNTSYSSNTRVGTSGYHLRSARYIGSDFFVWCVASAGSSGHNYPSSISSVGLRPAMSVAITPPVEKGAGDYHVLEYGSYPKTYVGDSLNSQLESYITDNEINENGMISGLTKTNKTYITNSLTSGRGGYSEKENFEYSYQGEKYVRIESIRNTTQTYSDGASIPENGTWVWFKVEPIRWIILNWHDLPSYINPDGTGTAQAFELIAEQSLLSNIPFYINTSDDDRSMWKNSTIRTYLNNTFINQAFSEDEASQILNSTITNTSSSGIGYNSPLGDPGQQTEDKLYLLSYWEVFNIDSPYSWLFKDNASRMDSPTDFALSNRALLNTNNSTSIRNGTGDWWSRSAYSINNIYYIRITGSNSNQMVDYNTSGIRPALTLTLFNNPLPTISFDAGEGELYGIEPTVILNQFDSFVLPSANNFRHPDENYEFSHFISNVSIAGRPIDNWYYPGEKISNIFANITFTAVYRHKHNPYGEGIYQTMYMGEYPKTYVGNSLNEELECAYNYGNLINGMGQTGKCYSSNSITSSSGDYVEKLNYEYEYNGERYVRVESIIREKNYLFQDNSLASSYTVHWFKVEPIRWIILNWDSLPEHINPNGDGSAQKIELIAEQSVVAGIPFYIEPNHGTRSLWKGSTIRDYLNETFINQAFAESELSKIVVTSNANTDMSANGKDSEFGAGKDYNSLDKLYLLSYWEVNNSQSPYSWLFSNNSARLDSPTDFALCNNSILDLGYSTAIRNGTSQWFLRSAQSTTSANIVKVDGTIGGLSVNRLDNNIRPAMSIIISDELTINFDAGVGELQGIEQTRNINQISSLTLPSKENFVHPDENYELSHFVSSVPILGNTVDHWYYPSTTIDYIYGSEITFTAVYRHKDNPYGDGIYETMFYGEYPKTYVGDYLNAELENAYNHGNLKNGMGQTGKSYATNSTTGPRGVFLEKLNYEYEYNGARYVRVESIKNSTNQYDYQNGSNVGVTGDIRWFKVEPIRWIILNWDNLPTYINPNGDGSAIKIELIAEQSLVAGIPFYPQTTGIEARMWKYSTIRSFLNETFINQAFNEDELSKIILSTLSNTNDLGDGKDNPTGSGSAFNTEDKVYLLSEWEAKSAYSVFSSNASRIDSPTDFALSNNAGINTNYSSIIRNGTSLWWLRSAASYAYVREVANNGGFTQDSPNNLPMGIRPVISITLSDELEVNFDAGEGELINFPQYQILPQNSSFILPTADNFVHPNEDYELTYFLTNDDRKFNPGDTIYLYGGTVITFTAVYVHKYNPYGDGIYQTLYFGEYPKTYVGDSLNATLSDLFNSGSLIATGKSYTTNSVTTTTGAYTPKYNYEYEHDGERYVRVSSIKYSTTAFTYQDGSSVGVTGDIRWFKVEPIRWIILNWDQLPPHINPDGDGTATSYELLAEQSLVAGIPFYPNTSTNYRTMWKNSTIRTFLNNTFVNNAFNTEERSSILTSTIANSDEGGNGKDSPTGAGESYNTSDSLYLLSYYEVSNASSPYNWLFKDNESRSNSPTDFALSNNGYLGNNQTNIRLGAGMWWLRSAYSPSTLAPVHTGGYLNSIHYPNELRICIRPAMSISFD